MTSSISFFPPQVAILSPPQPKLLHYAGIDIFISFLVISSLNATTLLVSAFIVSTLVV